MKSRKMLAGFPQGSVLGPLLWNVGYDSVLQEGMDPGCCVICYADDTLILATAKDTSAATARANVQVGGVLNRMNAGWASKSPHIKRRRFNFQEGGRSSIESQSWTWAGN